MNTAKTTIWHGCYESRWQGVITPASMAHPAKFSRDLIERIYDHCLQQGWLRKGDLVGDPFGGVGTGGITAAYRGLHWHGVELEPRFVAMAGENFDQHIDRWSQLGSPIPRIIQGDSRRFHELVCNASAVVASPPYSDIAAGQGGLNTKPAKHPGQQSGRTQTLASQNTNQKYGHSEGQISRLKGGSVDGVITSPPWEDGQEGGCPAHKLKRPPTSGKGHSATQEARQRQAQRDQQRVYGTTAGQIGQDSGETYWQAVAQVYRSCYLALRPGGIIALVVKDYVKNRKVVPLCDDTARLLQHVGFTVIERAHAMLVKEQRHADLFAGETVEKKERKSFFRRLAESKGSPRIDYEEVIFAQK